MKQGSTDDPFADDSASDDSSGSGSTGLDTESAGTTASQSRGQSQPRRQSLPYIHSRDGVKDGRTQRPVFLRDHVESGIDELVAEMERELGESVYKTDVTEAAMVVAQEHPELVLETLEEWGYGWD